MKVLLSGLATVILCGTALAGPFGIDMGQPLGELDVKGEGAKPFLKSVPKPHPSFESYAVWASDATGVCVIMAFSGKFDNDAYGVNILSAVDRFSGALDKKYGPHKKIDQLRPNALWDGPDEWIMSILQNERIFAIYWDNPESSKEEQLAHIEMQVAALSRDNSLIKLFYKSNSEKECVAAINAESDSSF